MRLRLVSDGTPHGTRVMDQHGRMIEGVQKVQITYDIDKNALGKMVLEIVAFDCDVEIEEKNVKTKRRVLKGFDIAAAGSKAG